MNESPYEYILMNSYKNEMISEMNRHPEYFKEAFKLAVSIKQHMHVDQYGCYGVV